MEGLTYNSIHIENYPERYKTQREREIERRRAEGLPMDVGYQDLQGLLDPFYRSYRCKETSYALICTKDAASFSFYTGSHDAYTYLDVSGRSRATDDALIALVPLLLGPHADPVLGMIKANLASPFYLGAESGYLVEVSTSFVSLEGVTW